MYAKLGGITNRSAGGYLPVEVDRFIGEVGTQPLDPRLMCSICSTVRLSRHIEPSSLGSIRSAVSCEWPL
jgi:hypothetical protein